jgi:hypothetical protein
VLHNANGAYELLQPVSPIGVGTVADQLLICKPTCETSTPLPTSSSVVRLVLSPFQSQDRTIFAVEPGASVSVTRDNGLSFTRMASLPIQRLVAIPSAEGARLVATVGAYGSRRIEVSDDDGRTWRTASMESSLGAGDVQTLTYLRPGRLLATVQRATRTGWRISFVCSTDGAAWSACTPDGAT